MERESMIQPDVKVIDGTGDTLGESPVWDGPNQLLYWVDVYGPRVNRLDRSGTVESWLIAGAKTVGSLALMTGGRLLLALDTGLNLFDPVTAGLTFLADPNAAREGVGYNDGKVDPSGRYWIGTLDLAEQAPRGVLHAVSPRLEVHLADAGFVVVNGPAFSPDGRFLYLSDSLDRKVLAYDVAPGTPRLGGRRVLHAFDADAGYPDGLTVDAAGDIWVAHYGGGRISRLQPDGRLRATYPMPCSIVASCAFGGADLRTLYITTGTEPDRSSHPAGCLLAMRVDASGLPSPVFDPVVT
jgi:xylono-1,5-lactonase